MTSIFQHLTVLKLRLFFHRSHQVAITFFFSQPEAGVAGLNSLASVGLSGRCPGPLCSYHIPGTATTKCVQTVWCRVLGSSFDLAPAMGLIISRRSATSEALVKPSNLECGICGDEVRLESKHFILSIFALPKAFKVPACNHLFCRTCLRTYTQVKVGERRFPIPCPGCLADPQSGSSSAYIWPQMKHGLWFWLSSAGNSLGTRYHRST